ISARRKQTLLAFENYCEIRGQSIATATFGGIGNTEHHAHSPSISMKRARETEPDTGAIGPHRAFAFELGVLPVDVEIQRAANTRTQETIAARQAACLLGLLRRWRVCRCGRSCCRRIGAFRSSSAHCQCAERDRMQSFHGAQST